MFKCILTTNQEIVATNEAYFRLVDLAWEASDIVLQNLADRKLTDRHLQPYRFVLVALYYKCCDCLLSIATLCACGQTEEAQVIVRKLFESSVNLKYISMAPEERAKRFIEYGSIHSHVLFEKVRNDPSWSKEVREGMLALKNEIEEAFEKNKAEFCDETGKVRSKYRFYWDGKTIPSMAKACGLADDLTAYEVFNAATHTSSGDVAVHFDVDEKRFRSGSNVDDVPGTLLETVRLFLIPLRLTALEFKLDLTSSLDQVQNALNYYGNKWNFEHSTNYRDRSSSKS